MSSENYRYYGLNSAGRIRSAEWFRADSDKDAIAQTKVQHADATCEIWEGRRLVARLSPDHAQP
jgi:hypothetical protein